MTSATLVSIAVTPATSSVNAGLTQQYDAVGTYTDGSTADITNQVTWTSSSTTTATIAAGGLATTLVAGSVTVTATDPKTKKTGYGGAHGVARVSRRSPCRRRPRAFRPA